MNKVDINYMYYVNAFSPPIRFVQFSLHCDSTLIVLLGILLQNMDNEIYVKINNCICFVVQAIAYKAVTILFLKTILYSLFSENSCFDGQCY